jgi:ABC-type multidrug transport system fused ATPase/permease subunit
VSATVAPPGSTDTNAPRSTDTNAPLSTDTNAPRSTDTNAPRSTDTNALRRPLRTGEWFERQKYYALDAPRAGISLRNKMGWALYVPGVTLFQNALSFVVFAVGARMVALGSMTGSDFAAFYMSSEAVQGAMSQVAGQIPSVMTAVSAPFPFICVGG